MKAAILLSLLVLLPFQCTAQSVDTAVDFYQHGKYQRASDILFGLIQQNSKDISLRLWLGKTLLKLRRWDHAIAQFEKAVELAPKDGVNHLWLGRAYGRKAEHALIGIGPAIRTRKEFEIAAQLAPDDPDIRFDLMEFYLEAPEIMGGGKDKAGAQAKEIARLSPRLGFAAQADIYENGKDWDRALEQLAEAVQRFPKDAGTHLDLAKFHLRRGNLKEAEAAAQKAVALDGADREARMYLAAATTELKKNDPGVLKMMQELAAGPLSDKDPDFEEIYYWLGRAYLVQGKQADAKNAFETSLRFNPDYPRSKDALKQIRGLP
jgi:tetratricopeptide (TPR) repeat protein